MLQLISLLLDMKLVWISGRVKSAIATALENISNTQEPRFLEHGN